MNYSRMAKMLMGSAGYMMMEPEEAEALNLGPLAKKFRPQFSSLMDKKPRMEIDDSAARILQDTRGTMGEVFHHPELYENYPDLKNMYVNYYHHQPMTSGSFNGTSISIGKGGTNLIEKEEADKIHKDVLLHEIQHAIQEKEGFARGGNPVSEEVKDITYNRLLDEGSGGVWPPDSRDVYETYKRLAGEIESNDVAARAGLSAEQRLSTPHYSPQGVPLEDTITRFRSMASAQALQEPWLDPVSIATSGIGVPGWAGKLAAGLFDVGAGYLGSRNWQGPYKDTPW